MMARGTQKKAVRILLVGEPGVGKTSLILSLVSEEFPEDVPAKAEEITIPADVTPERVPTHIVDYSVQEQNEDALQEEIRKAHAICVVYAVDDDNSIDRIRIYWLPFIRETLGEEHRTPVILVGNKCDLVEGSCMEAILPLMNSFAEVETCVECSARTLKNISEMFFYAQKAVLHPTGPLYIAEQKDLTENCRNALIRIFKICDSDNDAVLNDFELTQFQRRCFHTPLQPQNLEEVKAIVRKNVQDGILNGGLSLKGFLFLHTLFIQRGRHETTWTVLRKFGYDNDLQFNKDYLHPLLHVPHGCSTELSHSGIQFFTTLFTKYDQDCDQSLSPEELADMFSTCPLPLWGPEIASNICTNGLGWPNLQGFLAAWVLTAFLDVTTAIEYLAYFGYTTTEEENQLSAIHVTREKKVDLQKRQTSRNVFLCHVIGSKHSGKSAFMQAFVGRNLEDQTNIILEQTSHYTINTVQVYGQEKYLVLKEIDLSGRSTDTLTNSEIQCDVACLIYDSNHPRSFEYVARIFLKYYADIKIPCLMIANKSDLNEVRQEYLIQPTQFCNKYKIPPPQLFNCVGPTRVKKDVYAKLATMAAYPTLKRLVHVLLLRPSPSWLTEKLRNWKELQISKDSMVWIKAGLGMAAVAAFGMLIVKVIRTNGQ